MSIDSSSIFPEFSSTGPLLLGEEDSPAYQISVWDNNELSPARAHEILAKMERGGLVILGAQSPESGWPYLLIAVSPELRAKGIHAGRLADEAAHLLGGGGGGRPDVARCGGPLVERLRGVVWHLLRQAQSILELSDPPEPKSRADELLPKIQQWLASGDAPEEVTGKQVAAALGLIGPDDDADRILSGDYRAIAEVMRRLRFHRKRTNAGNLYSNPVYSRR